MFSWLKRCQSGGMVCAASVLDVRSSMPTHGDGIGQVFKMLGNWGVVDTVPFLSQVKQVIEG